jgi:5S rRNA maturation endonuclease (ribonuclease M5)
MHGWTTQKDKKRQDAQRTVTFKEAVDWCCKFIGQNLRDIKVDYAELEKRSFTAGMTVFGRKPEQAKQGVTRGQVRPRLEIPAPYFVERGWSAETLNHYDVGMCLDQSKPFHGRAVVPIYDDDYRVVVGYTARSIHPRCEACTHYHQPGTACPGHSERLLCSKWRNSTGFNKECHLYNNWFAKKHIRSSGVICLCEGPGDVWRLEEAGIHVGVGMFGVDLSDTQQVIIEMSGASSVVILTNNDQTGNAAAEAIRLRLRRCFRVYRPEFNSKDLGELRPEAVRELLLPTLTQIRKRA